MKTENAKVFSIYAPPQQCPDKLKKIVIVFVLRRFFLLWLFCIYNGISFWEFFQQSLKKKTEQMRLLRMVRLSDGQAVQLKTETRSRGAFTQHRWVLLNLNKQHQVKFFLN